MRVRVRKVAPEDVGALAQLVGETEYASWVTGPLCASRLSGVPTDYPNDLFMMERSGQTIGFIEIYQVRAKHGTCGVNFYVSAKRQGGLDSVQALVASLMVTFARDEIRKINVYVVGSNGAMLKALDRIGIRREATMRRKAPDESDLCVFAVFRSEYDAWRSHEPGLRKVMQKVEIG